MNPTTRRRLLVTTAASFAGGIAGCTTFSGTDDHSDGSGGSGSTVGDSGDGADSTPTPTGTATPTESPTPSPTTSPSPTPTPTEALYDPAVTFNFGEDVPGKDNGFEVAVQRLSDADHFKAYFRDPEGDEVWCILPGRFTSAGFYKLESGTLARAGSTSVEWGGGNWLALDWTQGESPERTIAVFAVYDGTENHLRTETGAV